MQRIAVIGALAALAAGCSDERPLAYRPAEAGATIHLRCGALSLTALARGGRLEVTPTDRAPMILDAHAPDSEGNVTHSKDGMRLVRHHDGQWTMHDGDGAAVACASR